MARASKPAGSASPSKPAAKTPGKAADRSTVPADQAPVLRKKELVDLVAETAALAKKDAKAAVEAVLQILGEALAGGKDVNLPPLGKARVSRQKDHAAGATLTIKLRRNTAKATAKPAADKPRKPAKEALAEDAE